MQMHSTTDSDIGVPSPRKRVRGRPVKTPAAKRQKYITVWLTVGEKAAAQKNAEAAGLQMSVFSREVLMKSTVSPALPSRDFLDAYAALARTTANINQISGHLNRENLKSELHASDAVRNKLSEIDYFMRTLAAQVEELRLALINKA